MLQENTLGCMWGLLSASFLVVVTETRYCLRNAWLTLSPTTSQVSLLLLSLVPACFCAGQQAPLGANPNWAVPPTPESRGYVIGSGDQITVHVMNLEEIPDKPVQVDLSGFVTLPLIGRLQVSGLTIEQVEADITGRLKRYVLHPHVAVSITEFRSQPVSVIGAVRNPGVHQVQGHKTLVEMLSLAGGVDNTVAGSVLTLTRRLEWGRIPLPGAANDPTDQFSIAQVSLKSIVEAKHPEQNILIKPYDVIAVPRAEIVYVIGEVLKSGGFPLTDGKDVTALQALSMAGGPGTMARPQNARILRRIEGASERTEIAIDLRKILDGKTADVRMQAEDILFVPNNVPKRAALRALEAGVQIGTGLVIWRRP
jgi:polysaccharide export outer membrane protein